VFKTNLQLIRAHNAAAARGEHTYTMGVNKFTDLSNDEFVAQMEASRAFFWEALWNRPRTNETATPSADAAATRSLLQTTSVDWVAAGKVTPVWNQGQCGSDYAFVSIDAVSSAKAIATNTSPMKLSAQKVVDCSYTSGNQGCNGGTPDETFHYLRVNGLPSEASYPYTMTASTCKSVSPVQAPIQGYTWVSGETALQTAVNIGPVAIALEATRAAFQYYSSGVLSDSGCGSALDHALLLVGYGTDTASGKDYWLVKNTWGALWGESGYVRIERGSGLCGIGDYSVYPIV